MKIIVRRSIAAVAALALLCLILYFRHAAPTRTIAITPDDAFRFEHGYVWGYTGREVATSANLWMLYPGAEPRNKLNHEVFSNTVRAHGRLVTFQILPRSREGAVMRAALAKQARQTAAMSDQNGLALVATTGDLDYFKVDDPADRAPYIVCRSDKPITPHPGCTKYAALSDRLTISFSFSRQRLLEWDAIQAELIHLVQSKRTNRP